MDYKSKEERYFSWYLDELVYAGFVHGYYYEPWSIKLYGGEDPPYWNKRMKTKIKELDRKELQPHSYTPDFIIHWNRSAEGIFVNDEENGCIYRPYFIHDLRYFDQIRSVVDVKSAFDQNNMNRLFSINRKWIYVQEGIFINKIVPLKLFKATFTPERYLLTDKSGKERKLDHEPRTLEQFKTLMTYDP